MPMKNLALARGQKEDWTGLKDVKQRKKLQTRLNVRAYRRRRALEEAAASAGARSAAEGIAFAQSVSDSSLDADTKGLMVWRMRTGTAPATWDANVPLSRDHLIQVVNFNVQRAIMTNMIIMWRVQVYVTDCPMNHAGITTFPTSQDIGIPESMMPTALQLSKPDHPTWIDVVPDPQMRDNLIIMDGHYDAADLVEDITGWCAAMDGAKGSAEGLIVWNDPWCPQGWEITEGFGRKWINVLKGCHDLLESTNKWRASRNEEPLVVEL